MTASGHALLTVLAMAPLACGDSLSAQPEWVQWFSYRWIHDLAVAPSGEITVVGRTMGDELVLGEDSRSSWRPFVARLDAEGEVLDDWHGFDGIAIAVVLDGEGRAYVVLDDLTEEDHTELRALDHDGSIRWSKQWSSGFWPELVIVDEAVVVRAGQSIEAFELDGRSRWRAELPSTYQLVGTDDDALVVVDQRLPSGSTALETFMWRYDARDGARTETILELPEQRFLSSVVVAPEGLVITSVAPGTTPPVTITSFTSQGRLRWERQLSPGFDEDDFPAWVPSYGRLASDGEGSWLVGAETWLETAETPDVERRRMWLQRWSDEGAFEGSLRYAFEEPGIPDDPEPDALARGECISSSDPPPSFGSQALKATVLPGDALLVTGVQGCRDSFLLRLAIDR